MSEIPTLDRSSTDPMHWAEQFCKVVREHDPTIDEDFMVGWFANYWAAVHDPLATCIDDQLKQIEKLEDSYVMVMLRVEELESENVILRGLITQSIELSKAREE